jgi:hypothetical protein
VAHLPSAESAGTILTRQEPFHARPTRIFFGAQDHIKDKDSEILEITNELLPKFGIKARKTRIIWANRIAYGKKLHTGPVRLANVRPRKYDPCGEGESATRARGLETLILYLADRTSHGTLPVKIDTSNKNRSLDGTTKIYHSDGSTSVATYPNVVFLDIANQAIRGVTPMAAVPASRIPQTSYSDYPRNFPHTINA